MSTVPAPYISVEALEDPSGSIRTRGYVSGETNPQLLVLIARDVLLVLERRNMGTSLTEECITELNAQIDLWGIRNEIHPESGNWLGVTARDWKT